MEKRPQVLPFPVCGSLSSSEPTSQRRACVSRRGRWRATGLPQPTVSTQPQSSPFTPAPRPSPSPSPPHPSPVLLSASPWMSSSGFLILSAWVKGDILE